jgi:hypothetical protein
MNAKAKGRRNEHRCSPKTRSSFTDAIGAAFWTTSPRPQDRLNAIVQDSITCACEIARTLGGISGRTPKVYPLHRRHEHCA